MRRLAELSLKLLERGWISGSFASSPDLVGAQQFCLSGAIHRAALTLGTDPIAQWQFRELLLRKASTRHYRCEALSEFNDRKGKAAVIALLRSLLT